MLRRIIRNGVLILIAWIGLSSWGYVGHKKISEETAVFHNRKMKDFREFTTYMIEHSSDPDKRKSDDKTEGHKHYIDIDGYPEFLQHLRINENKDSLIEKHGKEFVDKHGVLPWATLTTYDSLVACFSRSDIKKAMFFAADLSHYVADGHMPLHLSKNYDGQLSNNKGIHRRYESNMIETYVDDIQFEKKRIKKVCNVSAYVFDYLYQSVAYVDTIIAADDYAKTISEDVLSDEYKHALWTKTNTCTHMLFNDAAYSLTELIYTAWSEAGKPTVSSKRKR